MYLYMQVDGLAPPGPWDAGDLLNLTVFVRHMVREYRSIVGLLQCIHFALASSLRVHT